MNKHGAYILIVDNDIESIRTLEHSLTDQGYTVFTTRNAEDALKLTLRQRPDVLLLNLVLPGTNGLEICRKIRTVSNVPIIAFSVKDTQDEKVLALDLGADDYITQPFGMEEMLARVRVALRHVANVQTGTQPLVRLGPLLADLAQRKVWVNGQEIKLTPTEYELLKIFLAHRGTILTRHMLVNQLWKTAVGASIKIHRLHIYVARLRRKLEPVPDHPQFIFTVPCVGYRFVDEQQYQAFP